MKSRRSIRGLSPIFATLILIAIAVIAGIIVYMFTSGALAGLMGGGTAGQEKVAIQSAAGVGSTDVVTVIYQSTGGPLPTITGMLVKDASGNTIGTLTLGTTGLTPSATGILTTVTGTGGSTTGLANMAAGTTYTVTVITAAGGSFVSPAFTAS